MTMKYKVTGFLCAVLAAVLLSGAANLPPREDRPPRDAAGRKGNDPFREMARELKLTEGQLQRIEENRRQHMQEERRLIGEMMRNRDEVRRELAKADPDMIKIKAAQIRIKLLLAEEEDFRLQGILDLKRILTVEQFDSFNRKMEEKMRRPHRGIPPFKAPSGP